MDMQRQLPEIEIEGTTFLIDVALAELREKDNPYSCISFYSMDNAGDHYTFEYDTLRKAIVAPFDMALPTDKIIRVELPMMVALDPAGMALKYGIDKAQLPDHDSEFKCDESIVKKRLSGILPTVNICDEPYIVDLRLGELRKVKDPNSSIVLDKLEMSANGEKYLCFYDTINKEVVQIPDTVTEMPKHVVMVHIPNEIYLDAVAVARQFGEEDTALINRYPLQAHMSAAAYPLSVSGVPKRIEENLKKQKQQLQSRKRRGKHL